MRKALLLAGILFMNASVMLAQDSKPERPTKGTYQIEVHNTRANPFIPNNLESLVRENRKANQISYVRLGENVRLKILPESEINRPGFTPPAKEIVHIFGAQ